MASGRSLVTSALLGVIALCPKTALAWTEARVTTVSARLQVAGSGATDVDLDLGLSVDAGWLEGLEIAGLDPDLVLDESIPIVVTAEDGETYQPSVTTRSGRVSLSFKRRDAPRRGHYRARIRYRTDLGGRASRPTGDGSVRFEWTLPGWQSGLDGVSIQIAAPRGALLPPDELVATPSVELDRRETSEGTILTMRRAHLPRTTPWVAAFEVPEEAVASELRGPRSRAAIVPPPPVVPEGDEGSARGLFAFIAALGILAIVKRFAFERAARACGGRSRPLLPIGRLGFALTVACLAIAAGVMARRSMELFPLPLVAIVVLAIERSVQVSMKPRLGAFRPISTQDLSKARRVRMSELLAPIRWLDATSPLGAAVALTIGAALLYGLDGQSWGDTTFEAPHAAALLVCLMLTGPTTRIPRSPAERLLSLVRLAKSMRSSKFVDRALSSHGTVDAPGLSLRLLVHEDAEGRLQDARLRVCTEERPSGLLRFDIVCADRDGLGGHHFGHAVLVVTRAGSSADEIVGSVLPRSPVQHAPAGRRARMGSLVSDLPPLLAALGTSSDERAREQPPCERPTDTANPRIIPSDRRLAS